MADSKITALTSISTSTDPANDPLVIVDVSDTSMAATGTTKKVTLNNLLACSPTATLASATITGDLTVDTSTLKVDSTNNRVGIGTASPGYTLHAVVASGFAGAFRASTGVAGGLLAGNTAGDLVVGVDASGNGRLTADTSKYLGLGSNGINDRAILDTSGNLGLGVTPNAWQSAFRAFQTTGGAIGSNSASQYYVLQNAYLNTSGAWTYTANGYATMLRQNNGAYEFFNAASGTAGNSVTWTQAMTLDASGNLLVGKTASSTTVAGSQVQPDGTFSSVKGDTNPGFFYNRSTAASGTIALFRSNGVTVGSITQDGTNTSYVTSSDYRLKESVQPMVGALSRVLSLKPVSYKWKSNGSNGEGFLAHELAEVVPLAVTGKKDDVDADGKVVAQGVDYSKLVSILTAAVQELATRVIALENK